MNEESDLKQSQDAVQDESRRQFLLTSTAVLGSIGAVCALTPFISSWLPNDKAQATGAAIQVDLSKIAPGEQLTVEWRGKPVWILRRTVAMLQQLNKADSQLRDPDSLVDQQPAYAKNKFRSINPEYLVLIGLCTHLGCSPKYKPVTNNVDWAGGFLCPCHGSIFDLAGRVFKNVPAPINMEVPPYYFIDEHTIVIGEDNKP